MTSPHQERAAGSTASRKATTTLIPSPNPAAVGQAAAGTVTFPDGTTVLGTAALSAGGHTVAAVYGGDASDVTVGADLLRGHADLTVLGDKAYISAPLADEWRAECAVALLTVPRRNQRHQLPATPARRLNAARQIVETVNDQLTAQLGLAAHHAHTPRGLCARLQTKLAAHTLCLYLNRLLGQTDWLQIKALAFPNEHKALVGHAANSWR